jgi:hypothetical protein
MVLETTTGEEEGVYVSSFLFNVLGLEELWVVGGARGELLKGKKVEWGGCLGMIRVISRKDVRVVFV